MTNDPTLFANHIADWSAPAQKAAQTCRALFAQIATQNGIGTKDESLKWGQLSWRPERPRTGSTLRMVWAPDTPDTLSLFVDCKTDLASRMSTLYPDVAGNDGRRCITFDLTAPLPEQAVAHLAQMTFTYHLSADPSAKRR
ncbi:hypothetical protein Z945_2360 [Sulfitobacter noctilucae]|uniref:hypothetical protein n=1 Tax=Sulfitobacter noctilucae TaxID=1342302 RepID=UPI000468B4F6|nr:hypothetical protein [Sulfitobacter noctilucae]KIN61368.1 hypothetical protein Z945_2360 [Sulfitobacter noctilucae]